MMTKMILATTLNPLIDELALFCMRAWHADESLTWSDLGPGAEGDYRREAQAIIDRYFTARQNEVSVEELTLALTNARRRLHGFGELSAAQMQKMGLFPLKAETLFAASALLAEYRITKRNPRP